MHLFLRMLDPVPPKIMPFTFGEESLTSGQPVAVQCTVLEGDLPLTMRWAFHGQELSSQMGISIIKAGAKVSLLTIDSIAAGHSGDYTCTVANSASSTNYTATLAVNGLSRLESRKHNYSESQFQSEKILFLSPLNTRRRPRGLKMTLVTK